MPFIAALVKTSNTPPVIAIQEDQRSVRFDCALVEFGDQAGLSHLRLCMEAQPGLDNVEGNIAVFRYEITADSGYQASGLHTHVTADQYRQVMAALHGTLREARPDTIPE